jgi:hypothetical protein
MSFSSPTKTKLNKLPPPTRAPNSLTTIVLLLFLFLSCFFPSFFQFVCSLREWVSDRGDFAFRSDGENIAAYLEALQAAGSLRQIERGARGMIKLKAVSKSRYNIWKKL